MTAADVLELPERQRDVLHLACKGLRTKEIAERLGLSHFTVSNHLKVVYLKLGVRSRSELIIKCLRGRTRP